MTRSQVAALVDFLRDRAQAKSLASEQTDSQGVAREGMTLLDVAAFAGHLDPDDPRLAELQAAGRFHERPGAGTVFLGGGDAVWRSLRRAAAGHLAHEAQALDDLIAAALSEPPPGADA